MSSLSLARAAHEKKTQEAPKTLGWGELFLGLSVVSLGLYAVSQFSSGSHVAVHQPVGGNSSWMQGLPFPISRFDAFAKRQCAPVCQKSPTLSAFLLAAYPNAVDEGCFLRNGYMPFKMFQGRYPLGTEIGSGFVGRVFDVPSAPNVVVKQVTLSLKTQQKTIQKILSEIELGLMIAQSKHEQAYLSYVLSFTVQQVQDNLILQIALPKMQGSLNDFIHDELIQKTPRRMMEHMVRFAKDMLRGVQCLHERGFAHLDIHPRNVLIDMHDKYVRAKLNDFGVGLHVANVNEPRILLESGAIDFAHPAIERGLPIAPASADAFSVQQTWLYCLDALYVRAFADLRRDERAFGRYQRMYQLFTEVSPNKPNYTQHMLLQLRNI